MTYLLHFTDEETARTERPDLFDEDGCLLMEKAQQTTAYTSLGIEPDYDENGDPVEGTGTPAETAPGYWLLLMEATHAEPLQLPEGIIKISPIWSHPMPEPVAGVSNA